MSSRGAGSGVQVSATGFNLPDFDDVQIGYASNVQTFHFYKTAILVATVVATYQDATLANPTRFQLTYRAG